MHDKLSEHYRADAVDGLPDELKEKLDQLYLQKLPNLAVTNPKVLVVFSGGNAVGKSTLAKRIETELLGIVLENDAIKALVANLVPEEKRRIWGELTWKYTMDLYARLPQKTQNGLVVRDGIIDWYFDRILPIFTNQGYKIFIVAYAVSRAKNDELIRTRGDTSTVTAELLLERLDEHTVHIKRFRGSYTPDIVLDDHNLFDHDRVIELLQVFIAT